MILDPRSVSPDAFYHFMISAIVPRPIAFITTVNPAGRVNAAPFSFFTGLTSRPPLLGVSIQLREGEPKDTLRNLRDTGELVVNVVGEELAEQVVRTSGDWPEEVDELELVGLTALPSDLVKPPRVAECPVSLECRLHREVPLGGTVFVVGEILRAHVKDQVLTGGRVDPLKLRPLARLGGESYTVVREVLRCARPRVERRPGGGKPA
ncbi:MAG: flavin reductase family protein [Candidatus Eisenbacteria bacterium]|nr:flavin reductase family protein [Candidatus Eisenbacteria bacterium]